MTKLMETAIESVRKLSDAEQDVIAQIILDEVESEQQWDLRFAKGSEVLQQTADSAWAAHESGQTMTS